MECETLTANTHPTTHELFDLIAGGGVRVQQADGEARGERAVYTHSDQLLKLLGQSVIDRPEVIYTSSKDWITTSPPKTWEAIMKASGSNRTA